jgi:hypothetical protein
MWIGTWAGRTTRAWAAFAGQVLEPLAENLSDSRFTLAMPTERWIVFAQFMAAGLMTYIATLAWLEKRRD